MRIGYIRLSKAGPSLEDQQASLAKAGDLASIYVDEVIDGRLASDLPERANAIRSLEPDDELIVSSSSRLGTSVRDVLSALQDVALKRATVYEVETGETVGWHPDAMKVIAYAQRVEIANRKEIADKMRLRREETGQLGGSPRKPWKVTEQLARELWNDLTRTAQSIAADVGTSVPTLYRRFGERGTPRGGDRRQGRTATAKASNSMRTPEKENKGLMMAGNRSQLRDENGSLIGGLVVEDYNQGIADYEAEAPWPDETSASYDLGRQRAAEKTAAEKDVLDKLARRQAEDRARMKAVLPPELYAEYERNIDEIDARYAKGSEKKKG